MLLVVKCKGGEEVRGEISYKFNWRIFKDNSEKTNQERSISYHTSSLTSEEVTSMDGFSERISLKK